VYVRELVALGALNGPVKNQNVSVCLRLEDENVLVQTFFDVQDLPDLQGHRLAGPLRGDLTEPTIWRESGCALGSIHGSVP